MKLTIFSRLLIGYAIIFILVIGMNTYAIVNIGRINKVTQSILSVNNRMIDSATKLSDTIISQMQYEMKSIIYKDKLFADEFRRQQSDVDRYLNEMAPLADTHPARALLNNIKDNYRHYQTLVSDEFNDLKKKKRYASRRFDLEKKKYTKSILGELEQLRIQTRLNTTDKIESLNRLGTNLRRTAILMTGAFLVFGIVMSLMINRSITQPVSILERKIKEIGGGHLAGDLQISSPPELASLASAFNLMCKKLMELEKMKSNFFASITHELRTPLTTIKMGSGLLQSERGGPLTKEQKEILTTLDRETNRLIELVNSILDLAKMEAGMMSFTIETRNISPLIDQAIQEMGPLLEVKKIHLEREEAEGLPELKIDSERMLQALRNILGNAIKFTPEKGRVRVSVRANDLGVEVKVADTGPGIPAENLITIFDKFQQATTQGSSSIKGTGLGLAFTKEIITRHGGKIWAESEIGHGSSFIFVLPV